MQKVYNSLKEIEEVVKELLPPRLNKYIGSFNLTFLLSSEVWEFKDYEVTLVGERGITYMVMRASIENEITYLQSILDPYSSYSDDHGYWQATQYLKNRINMLKSKL